MQKKLKDSVSFTSLKDYGYRFVSDSQIAMIKTIDNHSVFIEHNSCIYCWDIEDIQDLIDAGFIED